MGEKIFKDRAAELTRKRRLIEKEEFRPSRKHEGKADESLLKGRECGDFRALFNAKSLQKGAGARGRKIGEGLEETHLPFDCRLGVEEALLGKICRDRLGVLIGKRTVELHPAPQSILQAERSTGESRLPAERSPEDTVYSFGECEIEPDGDIGEYALKMIVSELWHGFLLLS